jgi:hypothetical protein
MPTPLPMPRPLTMMRMDHGYCVSLSFLFTEEDWLGIRVPKKKKLEGSDVELAFAQVQ